MSGAPNAYHLVSRWRVKGTAGEVADILDDPLALTRWWPSVYLDVQELGSGEARPRGRRFRLLAKGWLPYTLRWEFEVVASDYPRGFTIAAAGDFSGRGIWTIEQDGPMVNVTFDWSIRVEKPLLRKLSCLLKPAFEANHAWAMARGEESLALELARRRATSEAERARIPAPPGPVTYSGVALLGGGAAVLSAAAYLVSRGRRRRRRR